MYGDIEPNPDCKEFKLIGYPFACSMWSVLIQEQQKQRLWKSLQGEVDAQPSAEQHTFVRKTDLG